MRDDPRLPFADEPTDADARPSVPAPDYLPPSGAGTPTADPLPVLPYAGTSGWSGSPTSRERAERDDTSGRTTARQRAVLDYLADCPMYGVTWREVAGHFGWHHGQASGVLSNLHSAGLIVRTTTRRNRCEVYMLPEQARRLDATEAPRRVGSARRLADVEAWLEREMIASDASAERRLVLGEVLARLRP